MNGEYIKTVLPFDTAFTWPSVLLAFQTLTYSVTLKMVYAIGSRTLKMTLTGSEYRVQPQRLIQAHQRITQQAQAGDTIYTWSPLSHTNLKIEQFCLVLSSTLLGMEPAFSAFIIICMESKFTCCQSSRELWVTPRDGCCGTSMEIKETDG